MLLGSSGCRADLFFALTDLLRNPAPPPGHLTGMLAAPDVSASSPVYVRNLVHTLDQIDAMVRRLVREVTERQIHWQPPGGRSWSIAQCLDHLTVTNSLYVTAIRQAVDDAKPDRAAPNTAIRPGLLERLFLWNTEPPPKVKLRAAAQIDPNPQRKRGDLWFAFAHAEERIRRLMIESAAIDVNRTRFVNPLLRGIRFTIGTGFLIVLAHNRRHLWQAQRVRETAGFPAA
jgi:DinB family protein